MIATINVQQCVEHWDSRSSRNSLGIITSSGELIVVMIIMIALFLYRITNIYEMFVDENSRTWFEPYMPMLFVLLLLLFGRVYYF